MYPFSLLHIIQAAHTGLQQEYFNDFDTYNHPEFSYTSTAHAKTPNAGVLNYFNDTSSGRANCTDAATVFGSTPPDAAQINLWSCTLYLNLTRDLREGHLPNKSRAIVLENHTDASIATSTSVTSFISTCLVAWCDNSEACGKTACMPSETVINGTLLSAASVDTCLDSICGVKRVSSPDFAGIGVITSIFIQLTITSLIPIALLFCHIALSKFYKKQDILSEKTSSNLSTKIRSLRSLQDSLLISLDEFQRAQCCFAIAIAIASLITLYNGHGKVTRIDRNAITLASFAGTLPTIVVFGTLLLYKSHDMAYTTLLTSFTWILSLITGYLPLTRNIGEMPYTYIGAQPAACGGQPPIHVCKEWGVESSVEQFNWVASILSAITMASLALRYCLPLIFKFYLDHVPDWWRERVARFPKPLHFSIGHYVPEKLRPVSVRKALRAFVYLAVITSMVNCGVYVFMILAYIEKRSMHTEWSFGQVVAVEVWLPTILSFVNDCVYGLLRGGAMGFPRLWRVVRVKE